MATRATYLLPASAQRMVCFYGHYDGYPEVAAYKFWLMNQQTNKEDYFAGQFLRANEGMELTYSHKAYRYTEYRYTLSFNGELTAWSRYLYNDPWKCIYQGAWQQFVNQCLSKDYQLYPF